MSAHLSRIRLFQRHLRNLTLSGFGSGFGIGFTLTLLLARAPLLLSTLLVFTHWPFPPCSLVCGGQRSPHKPRLVVSHITCPPLSSSPHAHSFVLGTTVIKVITRTLHIAGLPSWRNGGGDANAYMLEIDKTLLKKTHVKNHLTKKDEREKSPIK
jgi:hypothetical protein